MAWSKEDIYRITAAEELKDGYYVNLGIGMPTEVANYKPENVHVILQSENGMLGMGHFPYENEVDADLINAGKQTISALPESSYFDSATSFGMIRGGHIDLSILGALEVSDKGDLANWTVPGKMVKGMGGAMDLVAGAKRIVVIMEHNTKDKGYKLVKECSLPLTGKHVVNRVITDLGIFDITSAGLILTKIAQDVSVEEIRARTEPTFKIHI
ncbi:putative succinyl-CoA:3-ketoacid-coenzyme A transferase subunit B [Rickettsiales bacterium Ac37b]|nr:putative succinyl-CoA:3-ketoacid-coenzyme A transferase subunit B [Rickettsiales bacterium Ac37b]